MLGLMQRQFLRGCATHFLRIWKMNRWTPLISAALFKPLVLSGLVPSSRIAHPRKTIFRFGGRLLCRPPNRKSSAQNYTREGTAGLAGLTYPNWDALSVRCGRSLRNGPNLKSCQDVVFANVTSRQRVQVSLCLLESLFSFRLDPINMYKGLSVSS